MRLTTTGVAVNVTNPVVGRITTAASGDATQCILLSSGADGNPSGYVGLVGLISAGPKPECSIPIPAVFGAREIDHLHDGDLVVFNRRGLVRTVFIRDSSHNALFVTERCNNNCLMCSQPPKDREDTNELLHINRRLIPLIPPETPIIGITGGEPTLLGEDLFGLLELLRDHLPNTRVHLLTNARQFASREYTRRLASVQHPDLVIGVPLYSDAAVHHDYIVQDHGAFDETMTGLHELARWDISVELRIVLHKLTVSRLVNWAEYIYRNLPFVVHVAFMGLEPTGHAAYHHEKLWIEPTDYQEQLADAIEFLSIRGMNVSIYNLQRCVLPPSIWRFARQSISDWKNKFIPECNSCSQRSCCAGFFQSTDNRHISAITAIH
jgi:His-Xaa-Ser system radical SAM maturase HxsC